MSIKLDLSILPAALLLLFNCTSSSAADRVFKSSFDMAFQPTSFDDGGRIPIQSTCDAITPVNGASPAVSWLNSPPATASYVIIFQDDYFSPSLPRWSVYNIPSSITTLVTGAPVKAIPGVVATAYDAPCPPINEQHWYTFYLYAMDSTFVFPQPIPPSEPYMTAEAFEAAFADQILDRTGFSGYVVRDP